MDDKYLKYLKETRETVSFRINYLLGKAKLNDISKFQKIELMLLLEYDGKLKERGRTYQA